jgi:hypothetical protein
LITSARISSLTLSDGDLTLLDGGIEGELRVLRCTIEPRPVEALVDERRLVGALLLGLEDLAAIALSY